MTKKRQRGICRALCAQSEVASRKSEVFRAGDCNVKINKFWTNYNLQNSIQWDGRGKTGCFHIDEGASLAGSAPFLEIVSETMGWSISLF